MSDDRRESLRLLGNDNIPPKHVIDQCELVVEAVRGFLRREYPGVGVDAFVSEQCSAFRQMYIGRGGGDGCLVRASNRRDTRSGVVLAVWNHHGHPVYTESTTVAALRALRLLGFEPV